LDRVDLKIYLGQPPVTARYNILRSCLQELTFKGIIAPDDETSLSVDCGTIIEQIVDRFADATCTYGKNSMATSVSSVPVHQQNKLEKYRNSRHRELVLSELLQRISAPPAVRDDFFDDASEEDCDESPEFAGEATHAAHGISPAGDSETVKMESSSSECSPKYEGSEGVLDAHWPHGKTALELELTAAQYLYVVASCCQVSTISWKSARAFPSLYYSHWIRLCSRTSAGGRCESCL
jgi:hypothetical protein